MNDKRKIIVSGIVIAIFILFGTTFYFLKVKKDNVSIKVESSEISKSDKEAIIFELNSNIVKTLSKDNRKSIVENVTSTSKNTNLSMEDRKNAVDLLK